MNVTLLIVNLWQYYVCSIGLGVTRCTLFMPLYLCRTVCVSAGYTWWSGCTSVYVLMRLLAAESRSTAGLLFPSQCHCGTILLTPYSVVFDELSVALPLLKKVYSYNSYPNMGQYNSYSHPQRVHEDLPVERIHIVIGLRECFEYLQRFSGTRGRNTLHTRLT